MYRTAIIDWHSRYIVGYELSDTLHVDAVITCVKKAIKSHGNPEIINSDQGSQVISNEYVNLLIKTTEKLDAEVFNEEYARVSKELINLREKKSTLVENAERIE